MSAPPIVPLARRLAEENNVDWRRLEGSGEGGSVVERDVLTYLAQVMRGEAATDPTPEPLPEGLSAWPEELERAARAVQADRTEAEEVASPWTFEPLAPPTPLLETDAAGPQAFTFDLPPTPTAPPELPSLAPDGAASSEVGGGAYAQPDDSPSFEPERAPPPASVPESVHQAALEEVQALKGKVAQLEEERRRHLEELHQLARLQETIAAQKAEKARSDALQREVRGLKEALEAAQQDAAQLRGLEATLLEREERLTRARLFKAKAKTEVERLLGLIAQLEGELAAFKARPRWKFWG